MDDYQTIHQVRFKIILDAIYRLSLQKGARVLDVGCYPLYLFNKLKIAPFGFRVQGIASEHEPVKKEKDIVCLNIEKEKLPYPDACFDLVLLSEVIEHLSANPDVYLKEIYRVLKPNGYLLITTPNAAHLKNRIKLLFGNSPSFSLKQLYETKVTDDSIYFRHNREFTMKEVKEVIGKTKFVIHKAEYISFYVPFRKGRKTSFAKIGGYGITRIFPPLRDSLLVVAQK